MQQAIHMLQLSVMELEQVVDAELEQNPVLEYAQEVDQDDAEQMEVERSGEELALEGNGQDEQELSISDQDFEVLRHLNEEFSEHFAASGSPTQRSKEDEELQAFLQNSVQSQKNLGSLLWEQARETFEDDSELRMAQELIGHLDERGFLATDLQEIALLNAFDLTTLEQVLFDVQDFDPPGIAARSVQEALQIQLRRQGKRKSLAYQIVAEHYEDLLHNRIPLICRGLGVDAEAIQEAVRQDIQCLDLQPGAGFDAGPVQLVVPDVSIIDEGGQLVVKVNDESLPPLRLNRRYMQMLEDSSLCQEDRDYISKKAISGRWLLRNIHQRNETLFRIAESLVEKQYAFLSQADGELRPLTMKSVAEEISVHESTVARAVANKYVDCPRGLLPLRSFFSNSYVSKQGEDFSSHGVKQVLQELIEGEDKRKPLSDEALSKLMREKGIDCARRTVAKYRREMNIGNTTQRRSYVDS
jgi:RNA polymerase sigma-54 factor